MFEMPKKPYLRLNATYTHKLAAKLFPAVLLDTVQHIIDVSLANLETVLVSSLYMLNSFPVIDPNVLPHSKHSFI